MAELRLSWLGPPGLARNGHPIQLEMRKTLALLAYLSLSPQHPTREKIATIFWPEFDQSHALANLRRNLSSLASSLPAGLLIADRERIGLCREGVSIDVESFHGLLQRANEHHHVVEQACQDCIALLEQAVTEYRGDFLEGFNLKDCPEFDDWQFFKREQLRAEYAAALERLAGYYQQICEWERAIARARTWLALDRLHEPAHRLLMRLYFLSGQKSAAVRQYQECEQLLQQELGQSAQPETIELYETIRKETLRETRSDHSSKMISPAKTAGFPLTKTKFFLPKVPRTNICRPRLIAKLDQCVQKPLTLISASAGFGKTTLLAEWAAHSKERIAWVSLDRNDNDGYRLLDYIVHAIQNVLPDTTVGTVALGLLHASQPVEIPLIAGSLINDLISLQHPLILVLDDYHAIDSPAAHDVVNFLLDHQPGHLHLVISTRSDPPLLLARLRANLQLSEIRREDLRFTDDETQLFLTKVIGFPLSPQDLAFFEDKVEGWITGIQMAALAMQSNHLSPSSSELRNFIWAFKGSQRYILDYLIEEVLNRQPENLRKFLLRTSILERLCFPLCDSLFADDCLEEQQTLSPAGSTATNLSHPIGSTQPILELLERSNLFLIPLDDERKWYRYHHLFADLLHVRLQQYEPGLEAQYHKRAAHWYAQNAYPREAVQHALASGDYAFAADLIEEYSLSLIWMNQIVTTLDWFKSLPPEVIDSRPLLTIYQAFILARRGEYERVETILVNAEAYVKSAPVTPKIDEYKMLIFGMRAFMANLRGEPEKAIQHYQVVSSIPRERTWAGYFVTITQLAVAYLDLGDLSAAESIFTDMVRWALERQDMVYAILTNKELAEIQILRGRLSQAGQIYQQMEDWIYQTFQEPALYNGIIKVYEALLMIEKNELENAHRLLREDMETLLSAWRSTSLYVGYTALAYLYTAMGDFQRAGEAVEKALRWVTAQSYYPRNRSTVQACQVNLWLAEGNLVEAQRWAQSHFPQMPTCFPYIRELDHICLARILIASQRWGEALPLLQELSKNATSGEQTGRLLKINILLALALGGSGRFNEAVQILKKCFDFASPEGFMRVFLDEGEPMKKLILRWFEEGEWRDPEITNYINRLIQSF